MSYGTNRVFSLPSVALLPQIPDSREDEKDAVGRQGLLLGAAKATSMAYSAVLAASGAAVSASKAASYMRAGRTDKGEFGAAAATEAYSLAANKAAASVASSFVCLGALLPGAAAAATTMTALAMSVNVSDTQEQERALPVPLL